MTGVLALIMAVRALLRRNPGLVLLHFGPVVLLAGVLISGQQSKSGYLFLELGAASPGFFLRDDLRQIAELPVPVQLQGIEQQQQRGFRPAPVVRLAVDDRTHRVTYNQPLVTAGRRILLGQLTEPGFLAEYELVVDSTEYLLLHNQQVEIPQGPPLYSFGYDQEEQKIGLAHGRERFWLGIGDTATVGSTRLVLRSARFAANPGAILVVNDTRYRPPIFAGAGLVLLGLLFQLFRRPQQ